jgi:PAS domain S-box-containing protein
MNIAKDSISSLRSLKPGTEPHHRNHHSGHAVQFYSEDSSFLNSIGQAIASALVSGDAAVVIATSPHRAMLAQRLKDRGVDTRSAIKRGRYVVLDAAETLSRLLLQGWPDAARFADLMGSSIDRARAAAESDNPQVFAFGEMVALLWAEGKGGAAIQLEQLWNNLAETHSFSLRCAYPMRSFDREEHGDLFLKICAEHSNVIPEESYTALASDEERLRNISHLQQKAQALETERIERMAIEKSLRQREAELAEVLENAPEGVQQTGPDQKLLWANKAMLNLFGYAADEFIGHPLSEFYVHRQTFEEFWRKLMHREEVHDFPAELRCKDGSTKQVLIHANGRWQDGQFVHTRSFIRDVTERNSMIHELTLAHEELEMRVDERTAELARKNLQIEAQASILEMANRDLRELSARLLQVQDDERRRIARDLHDSTGQILALLGMTLSGLQREAKKFSPDLAQGLEENVEIVKQVSAELRTLSYLLHPPLLDEMGLESALRWYVDGFGKRSGIKVTLDLPANLGRLPRDLETAIYRIVQECLTNIHRHSGSPTATISLTQSSDRLAIEVADSGKGIARDKLSLISSTGLPGVGLRGMRERITDFRGVLDISSHAKGTRIKITIPLDAAMQGSQ